MSQVKTIIMDLYAQLGPNNYIPRLLESQEAEIKRTRGELDDALAAASIHADEHRKSRKQVVELEQELRDLKEMLARINKRVIPGQCDSMESAMQEIRRYREALWKIAKIQQLETIIGSESWQQIARQALEKEG